MHETRTFRVVQSASAAARLDAAAAFLRQYASDSRITIVGATRGAADDLARRVARERPATFGLTRLSLTELAARAAIAALAAEGLAPSTWLGAEAGAARAAFDASRESALRYFEPVAGMPGFPRALARTLQELRLTGIRGDSPRSPGNSGENGDSPLRTGDSPRARGDDGAHGDSPLLAARDLGELLTRFEAAFASASAVDRAGLLQAATAMLTARPPGGSVVLLDIPLEHRYECDLVRAAVAGTQAVLATVPYGDARARDALVEMGGTLESLADATQGDLASLRTFLFAGDATPPARERDGTLELFSAPGEGRECVEIARRMLAHARAGVPFDEMAILIRSPHSYIGLAEHALRRAGIPAWFDRGIRRPHPAGRAFLALLACAAEQTSAARFAEYLSLGQVPARDRPEVAEWESSLDDTITIGRTVGAGGAVEGEDAPDNPDEAAGGETRRAPWRWERLLGQAAVIGGDASRWRRRLEGYERELALQIEEAARQDGGDGGRVRALEASRTHVRDLQDFALPIVESLAGWPAQARWGEWLDRFARLAPLVLRTPAHVLRVLADLRPMASVGPVDLDETRRVLTERLLTLESEAPARRFGRVFVGTPQQARGRSFRVVFVPGLAERMFPQKPREDPLLLDALRSRLDPSLVTQGRRLMAERLLLQLAVGAASERLYVSYPRIELSESRARVPSFYALDLMRAATGRLPDHEALEEAARETGSASLAWPAPSTPEDAIDDQEHDLAVLARLLHERDHASVRGHAHYLLSQNDCLRRSVVDRWLRGEPRWSPSDGLTRVTERTAPALARQRLTARAYSLSALQRFSACPYQFLLSAVYRLQPVDVPQPLQRMDPLTRGSIFHNIQARFLRAMEARGGLPVTTANLEEAVAVLRETLDRIAGEQHEQLAPAVDRVWRDEIAAIRHDLEAWVRHLVDDGREWLPARFEWAFGHVPGERDPRSTTEDAVLSGGFRLRGAIDLIEEHLRTKTLRVTDHKTGRRPDQIEKTVVDGGAVLQPVLYAMAVEASLGRPVSEGRLFYCTSAGSFSEHRIPVNDQTRAAGLEVLQVIDRTIGLGRLAAFPTQDACSRCDYRIVCGPSVYRRVRRKPSELLADLVELRTRP